MVEPEAVAAMLRLKELGWGTKRIARELGVSRGTVKRYLDAGNWQPFKKPRRKKLLDGLEDWLRERLRQHRGNADVVRQELLSEKGIAASLRTVERAVAPYRQELLAEARATVRFETPPGKQLQIDFGERRAIIGDENVKVYLFVSTLGYSRRLYVRPFRSQRQESWFSGVEGAFRHFGGVTEGGSSSELLTVVGQERSPTRPRTAAQGGAAVFHGPRTDGEPQRLDRRRGDHPSRLPRLRPFFPSSKKPGAPERRFWLV